MLEMMELFKAYLLGNSKNTKIGIGKKKSGNVFL